MKTNLETIRKCLTVAGRIAARGAILPDAQQVADTMMELAYVLQKPWREASFAESLFESQRTSDLEQMLDELTEIDSTAPPGITGNDGKLADRGAWN